MSTADYLRITYADTENVLKNEHTRLLPFANSSVFKSKIVDARQLTTGSDVKRTYCLGFDIQNVHYQFQPGDTIGILPENDQHEVDRILERLQLTAVAQKFYHIEILKETTKKNAAVPRHIPPTGTLVELFRKHLDVSTPPKKLFLKSLLRFTSEPEEIDRLQHLTTSAASADYIDFIKTHSSLLTLLTAFPSCQPPVERLLEHLGPLQPRPYSISSSPLSKKLEITFSVIESGVCSGWLEKKINDETSLCVALDKLSLSSDNCVSFYFRKSNQFRLPDDPITPIIMVGPGTGVAPFIGFLQHRDLQKETMSCGSSWLFYGCRYKDRDFLFKSEIDTYLQNGTLTKLFGCSSRDGPNKVYVQDLIMVNDKHFVDHVVNNKAVVYVCGDAKNMVKDVKNAIVSCLRDRMEWTEAETQLFMKLLHETGKYVEDAWV